MINLDLRLGGMTTQEHNAWTTLRPVLRQYVPKALRAWQAATPEQRAEIAAHSPTVVGWLFEMFARAGE